MLIGGKIKNDGKENGEPKTRLWSISIVNSSWLYKYNGWSKAENWYEIKRTRRDKDKLR